MSPDRILQITEHEVYVYREIYYEHVKPLLRMGISDSLVIEMSINGPLETMGMTLQRYGDLASIDIIQRIQKRFAHVENVHIANIPKDIKFSEIFPELKCPRRTEQVD